RPRLVVDRDVVAELDDLRMRKRERDREEPLRIEDRSALLGEAALQGRDGDLGGLAAFGMAAHAVDDDEQRRGFARQHVDSVLIVLAVPRKGQFRRLDTHGCLLCSLLDRCSSASVDRPSRNCASKTTRFSVEYYAKSN